MVNDIGKSILEKIQEIKDENGGKIDIGNLDELVQSFISSVKAHVTDESQIEIFTQVKGLIDVIQDAKKEVALKKPHEIAGNFIPGATTQLSEVTEATESATNRILDNTEKILELSGKIEDVGLSAEITRLSTEIFEACNFQDLTGQRINKVIDTLEDIENRMFSLIKVFSGSLANNLHGSSEAKADLEKELLNGPQGGKAAPTQSEIDDIFSNTPANNSEDSSKK